MSTTRRAITGVGVLIVMGGLMCLSFRWGRGSVELSEPFGIWSGSANAAPEHQAISASKTIMLTVAGAPSVAAPPPAIEQNSSQSPAPAPSSAPSPPPAPAQSSAPSLPLPPGPQVVMSPSIVVQQSNIQQISDYPGKMTATVTHFGVPRKTPVTVSIPETGDEPLAGSAMKTIHLPNVTIVSGTGVHTSFHSSPSRSHEGSIDISMTRRDPETGKLTTTTRHIVTSPSSTAGP